jgi:hypothetical protein
MEKKIYRITFYRELLCAVDIHAASEVEAEKLFKEGLHSNLLTLSGVDPVDEICSVELFDDNPNQLILLN